MLAFRFSQRVRITFPDPTLTGLTGKVVYLNQKDGTAYVDMDEPLPAYLRKFTAPHDSRRNWLALYPEDCEEIP